MNLETVLYRVEGSVAVISLNRVKAMNSTRYRTVSSSIVISAPFYQ